jgi:hypothetical protein
MQHSSFNVSAAIKLSLGILFVILKAEVIGICITLLGLALIVMGIINLIHKDLTAGIIKIVIAVAVTLIGWLLLEIAIIVLGVVLLVNSILDILKMILVYIHNKDINIAAIILNLIEPVLTLVASVFLITSRDAAIEWAVVIAGILLIVNGVISIIRASVPKNDSQSTEIEVEYREKND